MKYAFIYYSYSGVTKDVVERISAKVPGKIIEVSPVKAYNAITAYSFGCLRARNAEADAVSPDSIDVSEFDHVVVAGPVWAWMPAPPVNGAIRAFKNGNGKSASVICTAGSTAGRTLEVMREALEKQGLKVTEEQVFSKQDIKDGKKIDEFINSLQ
jgi:flavodoxin